MKLKPPSRSSPSGDKTASTADGQASAAASLDEEVEIQMSPAPPRQYVVKRRRKFRILYFEMLYTFLSIWPALLLIFETASKIYPPRAPFIAANVTVLLIVPFLVYDNVIWDNLWALLKKPTTYGYIVVMTSTLLSREAYNMTTLPGIVKREAREGECFSLYGMGRGKGTLDDEWAVLTIEHLGTWTMHLNGMVWLFQDCLELSPWFRSWLGYLMMQFCFVMRGADARSIAEQAKAREAAARADQNSLRSAAA